MKVTSIVFVVFWLICVCAGAVLWPYTLNTWLEFLGRPATVLWWHGLILGLLPIVSQLTFPAAVVTWVVMLFI